MVTLMIREVPAKVFSETLELISIYTEELNSQMIQDIRQGRVLCFRSSVSLSPNMLKSLHNRLVCLNVITELIGTSDTAEIVRMRKALRNLLKEIDYIIEDGTLLRYIVEGNDSIIDARIMAYRLES